jgi:RNA polymerase sigma-70 factor (ECF subfamily)
VGAPGQSSALGGSLDPAHTDLGEMTLGDDTLVRRPAPTARPVFAARGAAPGGGAAAPDIFADAEVHERERRREQRLVEAACRGEESAIEALYRTHYDAIYRYVLLRLGSSSAAEDVTSQVFLGMVRGLGRYRDEGRPFVAWLYAMARKQVAFFQRGLGRAPGVVDREAAEELVAKTAGPAATAEQREVRVAIARALTKVPEGQREVIMLRYILSMSVADTAAAVGRTEGAVKQLQLRGLATLKSLLAHQGLHLD